MSSHYIYPCLVTISILYLNLSVYIYIYSHIYIYIYLAFYSYLSMSIVPVHCHAIDVQLPAGHGTDLGEFDLHLRARGPHAPRPADEGAPVG